jgi:hypothetical protein
MPRRNAALSLVALATLGLATACEKQSPFITVTAHGVVVKARATRYCRDNGKCNTSTDNPVLLVQNGDIVGIDVPRSVAEQGWRIGDQGDFSHEHYRSIRITQQIPPGAEQVLRIVRDERHGAGEWQFTIKAR